MGGSQQDGFRVEPGAGATQPDVSVLGCGWSEWPWWQLSLGLILMADVTGRLHVAPWEPPNPPVGQRRRCGWTTLICLHCRCATLRNDDTIPLPEGSSVDRFFRSSRNPISFRRTTFARLKTDREATRRSRLLRSACSAPMATGAIGADGSVTTYAPEQLEPILTMWPESRFVIALRDRWRCCPPPSTTGVCRTGKHLELRQGLGCFVGRARGGGCLAIASMRACSGTMRRVGTAII